jgi:hypothetical protein
METMLHRADGMNLNKEISIQDVRYANECPGKMELY